MNSIHLFALMLTFSITVLSYLAAILIVIPLKKSIYLAASGLRGSTQDLPCGVWGHSLPHAGFSLVAACGLLSRCGVRASLSLRRAGFSLVAVCGLSCLAERVILVPQVKVKVLVAQSCPTLCNPVDGSPPGFPVPGILQTRTLEWVAISFSDA